MTLDENATYYDAGGIETIAFIKAKLSPIEWRGYLLGNILKYTSRMTRKGQEERDAEKIKIYSNLLADIYKECGGQEMPPEVPLDPWVGAAEKLRRISTQPKKDWHI